MSIRHPRRPWVSAAVVCLVLSSLLEAASDPALTNDQIAQFLLTAKVVRSAGSSKGVTQTVRLTLSDGKLTHDASFQTVDEHRTSMRFANGRTELNFADSYKYNIAAYRLAELLGLGDAVPVYVERRWEGKVGSLSWWLPVKMDEGERLRRHLTIPDPDAWNRQMHRIRVLDQLVYDTDDNLTNVVITEDWKIWRIDFSRAFRLSRELQSTKDLAQCERQLLARLKTLDGVQLAVRTKGFLTKGEVEAVLVRRDKIVAHFQKLIAEKGEDAVLY